MYAFHEGGGIPVVDPSSVLITHLSETLKSNAHLLLGRQDVQALIDHLKTTHSALVAELLPDLVNLGIIQRVLQNLFREGVPILNLPVILEGIADFASLSKNPDDLSELVRRRLGLYFVPELESRPGVLRALTLDPRLEQFLGTKVHRSPTDVGLALDPATGRHLIDELNRKVGQLTAGGSPAVLVVSTETRLPLKRFLELAVEYNPVSIGDASHGGSMRPTYHESMWQHFFEDRPNNPDFETVLKGIDGPTTCAVENRGSSTVKASASRSTWTAAAWPVTSQPSSSARRTTGPDARHRASSG